MPKEPRGLGKGLSSLLGEVPSADQLRKPVGYINKEVVGVNPVQNTSDVLRIPLEMIEPNPYQPRDVFNPEAIEELAASIRTLGLIQPITVRKMSDTRYQIISGERRFRACGKIGMATVPAYVRETNNKGMLEMAIVENVQRENLDPIEVALSYQRLIDECSLTQEEMAQRLGKKRASVANFLRLLRLPARAQHDLKAGQISVGHAKVILGVDDPQTQEMLCDLIIKNDLSVRQLEDKVRELMAGSMEMMPKLVRKAPELNAEYQALSDKVASLFSSKASVRRSASGAGTLTVKFSSDAEVSELLAKLEQLGL